MAADLRQFDLPLGRQPLEVRRLRDEWVGHAVSPISGAVRGFTADGQVEVKPSGTVLQDSLNAYRLTSVGVGANFLRAPIPGSVIGTNAQVGAAYLMQFRTTSTATDTTIGGLGSDSGGSGNTLFRLGGGLVSAARLRATVGNATNNTAVEVTGSVINDGQMHTALVSLEAFNTSGSCTYSVYLDGVLLVVQTDAVVLGASHVYNWVCAGAVRRTSNLSGAASQTSLAVGFRRNVSRQQGIALTRDPWGTLFQPRRIWVPASAVGGGAQTIAIGQASETDTAQAFTGTAGAVVAIGQANETDAAQALTASQAATLGQAQETDLAQALAAVQTAAIGQALEADTAQALTSALVATIGQASETDEAQAVVYSSPGVIGQASETDAAQALQSNQVAAIGQASETDAAQPLTAVSSATIGMALEIDTAGAFASSMALAIGQATETDAAQAFTVGSTGGGTGASAAEVWDYVLSNGKTAEETAVETHAMLTAMTALLADCPANLLMVLRLLRNKQITDPNTGVFTIYADDSVTPLLQGNLFEDAAGATPYRGQGAERREKLS